MQDTSRYIKIRIRFDPPPPKDSETPRHPVQGRLKSVLKMWRACVPEKGFRGRSFKFLGSRVSRTDSAVPQRRVPCELN